MKTTRRFLLAAVAVAVAVGSAWAETRDEPVVVALVLDTSGSLHGDALQRRQSLAVNVVEALPAGSEMAVFAFDDRPRLVLSRTADRDAVAAAAGQLGTAGRYTALYDALFDASRYLAGEPGARKAILLVTDGLDENSAVTLEDGVEETRTLGIPVFAVGVGRVQSRVLRRIAKLTGGSYFATDAEGAAVAADMAELTPAAPTPTPVPAAPEPATVPAARAAAPAPTGGTAPGAPWWLLPLLAVAAVAVGGWLWSRRASEPPRRRERRDPVPAPASDDEGGMTLVTRLDSLEGDGNTLVLTLKPLLHVTRGPDAGRFFEVSLDSAVSIGRSEGNEIVLGDRSVSTQHCRIRPVNSERRAGVSGAFEVIDLESTNGTWVNERRVARHILAAGDVIKLGETQMQFRMDHMKGE